jgi:hypothetical protein
VGLPLVMMSPPEPAFSARTASTGSPVSNVELFQPTADNVDESTYLRTLFMNAAPSSSSTVRPGHASAKPS